METGTSDTARSRLTPDELVRLRAEKTEIEAEIKNYPVPIPGCDAQFNYLLERRAVLNRALANAVAVED